MFRSTKTSLVAVLALGFTLALTTTAQAAITKTAVFHIGETDGPGNTLAIDGSTPGATLDAAIGTDATANNTGPATFSSNAAPGSTRSLMITGGGAGTNRDFSAPHNLTGGTPTTNWGIQSWMYFPSTNPQNGGSNGNYGGYSVGFFNAQVWQVPNGDPNHHWEDNTFPVIPANQKDAWVHTAVVIQNGQKEYYVNGSLIGTLPGTASWSGNATFDNLWIGTLNAYGGDSGWRGGIDEINVFEFAEDAFVVNDLDFFAQGEAVPEPSTFVLAGLGLLGLGFFGWRKRKKGVTGDSLFSCAEGAIKTANVRCVIGISLVLLLSSSTQAAMLVSDMTAGAIRQYNATTGAFQGTLIANVAANGYSNPGKIEVGTGLFSNVLYVMVDQGIAQYNATTGAHIGLLTDRVTPAPNGANFGLTQGMAIRPSDGFIFVASPSYTAASVTHFVPVYSVNPTTGAKTLFYEAPNLNGAAFGMTIGYQGDLYIYDENDGPNDVRRANILTGANVPNPPSGTIWHTGIANSNQADLTFADPGGNPAEYWIDAASTITPNDAVFVIPDPTPVTSANTKIADYTLGTTGANRVAGRLYAIETGPDNNVYWTYDGPTDTSPFVGIRRYDTTLNSTTDFVISDVTDPRGIAWTAEVEAEAVPEPSTFVLAGLGLAGLGFFAWRKRRSQG